MTSIIKPKTPSGTLELLPREEAAFAHMLKVIRKGYARYGFVPIETPAFEETEILLTKSGGDTEKQVYFVQSTGSREQGHAPDLALRFDLTVPLARYVAEHQNELSFPFRRYQIGRVWRGERAQKGRFREFVQCDIDIVGRETLSPAHDAEVPAIIADIFRELNIGAFTIHVSNRKILRGYLESVGIADPETRAFIMREIDKAPKIGWNEVKKNLEKVGMSAFANLLSMLEKTANSKGTAQAQENRETLVDFQKLCENSTDAREGLAEIELLLNMTAEMGAGDVIRFNPAITRGLDYYTGTVYETFLNDHRDWGSICSGGRYDNLASYYTRTKLPGVGISIGLTRLFDQMRHANLIPDMGSSVKLLIAFMDKNLQGDVNRMAKELRDAGISTALYLEDDKLGKQIKYADKAGIPFMLVMGVDEKAKGVAALKNLKTGEQKEVPLAEIVAETKKLIFS
jgi:histidyl-tRNA synthetase